MSKPIRETEEEERTVATAMSASWDLELESSFESCAGGGEEGRDDSGSGAPNRSPLKKRPRVFHSESLQIGKLLGKGSFCVVSESLDLPHSAIKMVNPTLQERAHESRKRKETYHVALQDLAYEAGLLSSLNHPNIIGLQGISSLGASDFIVVERLQMTLAQRLRRWSNLDKLTKRSSSSCSSSYYGSSSSDYSSSTIIQAKNQLSESFDDRITIGLDLASVLEYLHSQGIVYRDLKPENIGFDSCGQLKLFDFGMAKRLSEARQAPDGVNFHLTSMTGTLRFMSPEVGTGKPYNCSADIYSWSMILYQLLSLQTPFGQKCTPQFIMCGVFQFGVRPSLTDYKGQWSDRLINLLKQSWSSTSTKRPTPSVICDTLECELNERAMYSSSSRSFDPQESNVVNPFFTTSRYFEGTPELRASPSSSSSSSSSSVIIEESCSFSSSSQSQTPVLLQSPGQIEIMI